MKINFQEALDKLTAEHREYHAAAYKLLYAVSSPIAGLVSEERFEPEHITVGAFYSALLDEAHRSYGPMAYTLFCFWGLRTNADLATALHHLVDAGLLLMSPCETPDDLNDMPPLKALLEQPYTPTLSHLHEKH